MRAWQVRAHGEPGEVLQSAELDAPEPGPGEVRLRVGAAGLGLPDVFMCRGIYPLTPPLPFVPGQEVAGVVTAVGEGVDVPIGHRAMGVTAFTTGRGGFAEETIVPARGLYPVSDRMSDADAASFYIGYHTAWIGLVQRAGLQAGQDLVVLGGAGGSGAAAVYLGHALGARVIATASGPERGAYCRTLGADVVIDHRLEPLDEAIREATGGRGADMIYDPVGGPPAETATRALANEGQLLLVGFASGVWPKIVAHDAVIRNYSVVGVFAGAYDRTFGDNAHRRLLELYDAGRIGTLVTRTVPFDQLPSALDDLAHRSALGRTVALPDTGA